MKKLLICIALCWAVFSADVSAQQNPRRVTAVGIDVFKNVPYLLFPTFFGGKNALIIEPTIQFATTKPNRFTNLTVGYSQIDQERDNNGRTLHYVRGFHFQLMQERQDNEGKLFWAYGALVAVGYGRGAIQIKGDFFPTYLAPLPDFSGAGLGIKFQGGTNYDFGKHWRLRTSINLSLNTFDYGKANPAYLPGAGPFPSSSSRNFSYTGGLNLQIFYLTKQKAI